MLVFLLILLNDGTFSLKNLSIILIVMDLTVCATLVKLLVRLLLGTISVDNFVFQFCAVNVFANIASPMF